MRSLFLIATLQVFLISASWAQSPSAVPTPSTTTSAAGGGSAQRAGGKVSGVVTDSTTNKAVEFATISLVSTATGKPVDGTVTDDRGRFTLNRVAFGTYTVQVSFIGYNTYTRSAFTVSEKDSEVELGNIVLKPVQNKLREVTVVGEKPLVEDKVDRMVYNAEQDITNIGGTASDVLKKVPSLTVDLDGNVQLRGSSNVRVLINNKPSSIMANSVADALRQIPSDMIKTVEVITSPSAKYDAEGSAGIINIITKKNTLYGVNGSVNASAGNRNANGNGNINIRRGKFGFNANLGTHQQYNNKNENELERFLFALPATHPEHDPASFSSTLLQQGTSQRQGGGVFGQIGFDADLDSSNSITAGVNLYRGRFNSSGFQSSFTDFTDNTTTPDRYVETTSENKNQHNSLDLNLGYTHIFKPQQELAVLGQWTNGGMNTSSNLDNALDHNDFLDNLVRNTNEGFNREMTYQVDYTHPFQNKTLLEVGTKAILRHAESDAIYRDIDLDTDQTTERANSFGYDQDVYATYASYGFKALKNYNIKSGVRFEYTNLQANYIAPVMPSFKDNYSNLIPNVMVSRTFKSQTVRAGYTQRIQRPQIWYLNPYVNTTDKINYSFGNPELSPELTHSYELGYSNYFKTSSVNVSLYWRQTNNAIENVRRIVGEEGALPASPEVEWRKDGNSYTTFYNIGKNATYGLSFSGNTKPIPAWNVGGSVNLNYIDLKSNLQNNAALQYSFNVNTGYDFGKGLALQAFGSYSSPRPSIQGKFSGFYYSSVSVKKDLWDKKGSISVGVDNPFSKSIQFTSDLANDNFRQNTVNQNFNRNVRVSFSYRFGKMDMNQQPRRKKSIRNDDAKGGGESN
ncbi:TonB-dependent receptor [Nibribacter ruber]|uniref:TonB-dependent receptor n=1 Tax=Nibribacter ruber TaxID=2698458 RepID=A0A6P1P3V6_9BACT|nr:outer membrane beta-barrel family protein [Nibribacter ruber]QHL89016.1 TonB-dependent receptor [Nibribacter ruber]